MQVKAVKEKSKMGDTLKQMPNYWVRKYGKKIAIVDDRGQISFTELWHLRNRYASYFSVKGVKKEDMVFLQIENNADYIIICMALFALGARPVLLHVKYAAAEILPLANICRPIIWVKGHTVEDETINQVCRQYDGMLEVVTLCELRGHSSEDFYEALVEEEDVAIYLLSSGTTGKPKVIPKLHGAFTYFLECMKERFSLSEGTRYLLTGPASHIFQYTFFLAVLDAGGMVCATEYLSPMDIQDIMQEQRINMMGMVPTMLRMCLQDIEDHGLSACNHMETLIVGGERLGLSTRNRALQVFSCKVVNLYGSGEGVFASAEYQAGDKLPRIELVGKPISEKDCLKIADGEKRGELLVKGPYVIKEYYEQEHNKNYFTSDGYYKTGDIAEIDDEGNIYIYGRNKDVINRGGEKIVPFELEEEIRKYEEVLECVVCGMVDDLVGEKIIVFIQSNRSQHQISLANLKKRLKSAGIGEYKFPDELVIISKVPKTQSGKILKRKLIMDYQNERLQE